MYLFLAQLVFMICGYIINVWLGRHLGPEVYGIYGILTLLMTTMNIMQVSGVPQAVSKFVAEDDNKADSILKTAFIIQLVITATASTIFFCTCSSFCGCF